LERVASQVEYVRQTKFHERFLPDPQPRCMLLLKYHLTVARPDRHDAAIIADVEEGFSGTLLHLACEIGQQVDAVDMDPERLVRDLVAGQKLLAHIRITGRR